MKMLGIGVLASTAQGMIGVGHGFVVNLATSRVLKSLPSRVAVGTAAWGFLGTGSAILAFFLHTPDDDTPPFLDDDMVFTAFCLGFPGMLTTPLGVMLGKKISNRMLTGVIGSVFVGFSPLILYSAWTKQNLVVASPSPSSSSSPSSLSSSSSSSLPPSDSQPLSIDGLKHGLLRVGVSLANVPARVEEDPWTSSRHVLAGCVGGILYGLAGVGPVLMTYLTMTTPMGHASCVATAMLAHYPRVLVGLASHSAMGNVAWGEMMNLVLCCSIVTVLVVCVGAVVV